MLEDDAPSGRTQTNDKPLYFAPEGSSGQLSPNYDAVAYKTPYNVFVQDVLVLDRKLVEGGNVNGSREATMSRAKQVGLGLIMYASDNDDELPPASEIPAAIQPYLKDLSITEGFIYTYRGPSNYAQIADPSKTELGFIRGVGGSAVLYADGSVRWKEDE